MRVVGQLFQKQLFLILAMAPTFSRAAIAGLGQFAVGADAGLGVGAPEQAIVAGRDAGIGLRPYILALPAEGRAQSRTIGIETF